MAIAILEARPVSRRIRQVSRIGLLIAVAVLSGMPYVSYGNSLPADAKKVIESYDKETASLRKSTSEQTASAQDKLLKKLRELQVAQTKAGNLDEAVVIRDAVRALEADKKSGQMGALEKITGLNLPAEAQTAVAEYSETVQAAAKKLTEQLESKQAEFNARLNELLEQYSKAGMLDEALAIRSHISATPTGAPAATPVGIGAVKLGDVSTDFSTVEKRYQKHSLEIQQANAEAYRAHAKTLTSQLNKVLNAETKAGRLDPAVAIRNLIQNLNAPNLPPQRLVEIAKMQRNALPSDALTLVDAFLKTADELNQQLAANYSKLNQAMIPHLEVEARKQLIAGNLEPSRELLRRLYGYRNEEFPYSWAGHYRNTPELSNDALPVFEAFAAGKLERQEQASAAVRPMYNQLLQSLKTAAAAKPDEAVAEAIAETIESLEAESTEKIRKYLLMVADQRLPNECLAAWKEFRNAVKKQFQVLNEQNVIAAKKLNADLAAIREKHVRANQFLEAFVILDRQQNAQRSLSPISCKVAAAPGFPITWDGSVTDVKDGTYLVEYTHRQEWLLRERFRVGNESAAISKQLGGPPDDRFTRPSGQEVPKTGPGKPVTEKSRLKVGQRLMAYWGSSWYPVTVMEVSEAGVKIHWEGYSKGFDQIIERTHLRDSSDD